MLTDINYREPVKVRDSTPKILVDLGIKDLPMYENPAHVRRNILTETEAILYGLKIGPRINYHGLGIDGYMKVIDGLDDPRAVFKNNTRNDYLIITTQKDRWGNTIIVPIEVETHSSISRIIINTNRIKTIFGYSDEFNNDSLHEYIADRINKKILTKIYTKKKNVV